MGPSDRLEQPQVRAARAGLLRDADDHRRARVAVLVHRVAESGHDAPGRPPAGQRGSRQRVPTGLIDREFTGRSGRAGQRFGKEAAAVLGDAQEPGAAAEQARRERTLDGFGRPGQRQAGGDRRRREAVVGQRDEHRLEHSHLPRAGTALGDEPERQFTEADLPDQLAGQVVTEQADRVLVAVPDGGRVGHRVAPWSAAVESGRSASHSSGGWPVGSRCLATRAVGVRGSASTRCQ